MTDEFDYLKESDNFDWLADDYTTETDVNLSSPKAHARREARRRFIADLKKRSLNELVPQLPPVDTVLYILSNGTGSEAKWMEGGTDRNIIDYGHFIPHLVDLLGHGCSAYVSTWTLSRLHVGLIADMLADGRLERLTFFADPYLRQRNPAIYATLAGAIERHADRAQLLLFKNHCKVICLASQDGQRFVTMTSSANLSSQPRTEQYTLDTAPEVHQFFVSQFFQELLNHVRK